MAERSRAAARGGCARHRRPPRRATTTAPWPPPWWTARRPRCLLGSLALGAPAACARLRQLGAAVAALAGARFGYLPEAGNACGAWLAGAVPHRGPAGAGVDATGLTARALLGDQPRSAYLLLGVEPEHDSADPAAAVAAMAAATTVVALSAFTTDTLLQHADVILPASTFAETDGTLVNAEGLLAGASPRPARRRATRARAGRSCACWPMSSRLDGFEYFAAAEIRREAQGALPRAGARQRRRGRRGGRAAGRA
ncbi:MAG: molybdopterin-dependent oxidoreductase [Halofilum sp. (in: g-proteobacteria)]|nr:molybdopterin-dependent oxidoreductase [Halofilum sp. (in: g-proteobacteria)]